MGQDYLAKAGLVEATRRGHFEITERGKKALALSPERTDNAYLSQFEEFQEFRTRRTDGGEATGGEEQPLSEDHVPDEMIRESYKEIEKTLRQKLLARVLAAPPDFFERLTLNLLVEMGYGGSGEDATCPLVSQGTMVLTA